LPLELSPSPSQTDKATGLKLEPKKQEKDWRKQKLSNKQNQTKKVEQARSSL